MQANAPPGARLAEISLITRYRISNHPCHTISLFQEITVRTVELYD